jgi:protein SCO1/2
MVVISKTFIRRIALMSVLTVAGAFTFGTSQAHSDEKPHGGANKQGGNHFDYTSPGGGVPKDLAGRVGIEQNLKAAVPLDLAFKDEQGKNVKLGDYFGSKPVMLTMLQLTCDQICSVQLGVMAERMNNEMFGFTPGKEFDIITVSLDPRESYLVAQDAKAEQMARMKAKDAGKGWHFLTGDEKNIKALAKTLGIKYIWDEGSKQYIHPDGIVLATPEGQISRYFMQLEYGERDMRYSLIEASKHKIGTFVDKIALSCFHYNPVTGRYSFQIMSFLRIFGFAFVAGSLLGITLMVRAEKKRNKGGNPPSGGTAGLGDPQLKKA